MKEFTYTITDPEGIHARPAGELVKAAKAFESAIKLNKEGKSADCKRVFGIMGLAVKQGQTVTMKKQQHRQWRISLRQLCNVIK